MLFPVVLWCRVFQRGGLYPPSAGSLFICLILGFCGIPNPTVLLAGAARSLDYVDIDWRHVFEDCVETDARNATFFPPLRSSIRGQLVRESFASRVAFCAVANMRCYTKVFGGPDSDQPLGIGVVGAEDDQKPQPLFFASDRYELRDAFYSRKESSSGLGGGVLKSTLRSLDLHVEPEVGAGDNSFADESVVQVSSSGMNASTSRTTHSTRPPSSSPPAPRAPQIRERTCRVSSLFAGCPGANGFYSLLAGAKHRERKNLLPATVTAVDAGATMEDYRKVFRRFGLHRFVRGMLL